MRFIAVIAAGLAEFFAWTSIGTFVLALGVDYTSYLLPSNHRLHAAALTATITMAVSVLCLIPTGFVWVTRDRQRRTRKVTTKPGSK